MPSKTFHISGCVIHRQTRLGIANLRVEAWNKGLIFNDLVGSIITDEQGHFQMEFTQSYFQEFLGRQSALFFKVFYKGKVIENTQNTRSWNKEITDTPVIIDVDMVGNSEESMSIFVQGKVFSQFHAGVGGLRVEIVDKNIGDDVHLAETVTDEKGAYQVTVSTANLQEHGKQRPDLQTRVFAGKRFLAASDIAYNASDQETLNILLTEKISSALPSEYETLTGRLSTYFQGNLRDLKETDERQDITYLANKSGWDARAIALAALADQFSERSVDARSKTRVESVFFYALFRAGLPANEDILYHTDAKTLEGIWKKAVEQGVIPKDSVDQIPTLIGRFQTLSAQKLLTGPALVGTSSLKEMLTVSRLEEVQREKFAQIYAANRTDMSAFWKAVGNTFGQDAANRLQVDGKLGFLTINNASLMQRVHEKAGEQGLSDLLQLAQMGYHHAEPWNQLLKLLKDVPIPKEIPGDTPEVKQTNYAEYLAAQVRLSYPTAAVAQMVKSGPLKDAMKGASEQVHTFLTNHQGKFEIGVQPIQQYITQNELKVVEETVQQIKRLQRVYQITPSDQAMIGLMKHGLDAAYHVVRYDKDTFVQNFAADLGGTVPAALTYDKSVQTHNTVLNLALSYLNARTAPAIGASGILEPTPANAGDVIAYATLESLFGSMDFCACDHCRSILSPAAYLVDLLLFLDKPERGEKNPQSVLLKRRPDIQHLPLTCENTNTALPYIDVVNETLEYFIANNNQKFSLEDYLGHDTSGVASEDLLASPQFVMDSAYTTLRGERFPPPLPFHQPLENLRRYFNKFEVSLPLAMEQLRKSDVLDVDRTINPPPLLTDYGWRDILMEELNLSRDEHEILTDSTAVPLWRMYGFPSETADTAVIAALSNAKQFTRRIGVTYKELILMLKTRFINPNSNLIPKLEKLGVSFAALKALKEGTISDVDFDALLPSEVLAPNLAEYGGDSIKAWVKQQDNYDRIMKIITLTDPTVNPDLCSFDNLEFRYSKPMTDNSDTSTRLSTVEFVRLLRFIRLWKKLGWTIEQTDAAVCALSSLNANDMDDVTKLNSGFLTLLPRLGIVTRVMKALNLTVKRDLLPLLACWSEINTHGDTALYRQMFLNPAILQQDDVFADNGYGEFLTGLTQKLTNHAEALRAAFNLTGEEYDQIVSNLRYDANTPLTIPNISAIFRRGWLARKLRLNIREFLSLLQFTGLDPFVSLDLTHPAILRLIELVQSMKDRSFKSAAALYLIWNQDLSGKSVPSSDQVATLARTLRLSLAAIETEFAIADDPDGTIARARMALLYGNNATNLFFSFLDNTFITNAQYSRLPTVLVTRIDYTHHQATLEQGILDVASNQITYDDITKILSFTGTLVEPVRNKLKNISGVTNDFKEAVDKLYDENQKVIQANLEQPIVSVAPGRIYYDEFQKKIYFSGILTDDIFNVLFNIQVDGVPQQEFQNALQKLYEENKKVVVPFFAHYPELQSLCNAYISDTTHSIAEKRTTLLKTILPELIQRRKRQQILQSVSAVANIELAFTQTFLDPSSASFPFHAAGHNDQPALNDLLRLEVPGLSVQFFANDTFRGTILPTPGIASNLDYDPTISGVGNLLPANPIIPGTAISGVWYGYLEAPESGFFNLRIEVDAGATVTLILDNKPITLTQDATIWSNTNPIELWVGMLYPIELKVAKVRDVMRVQWEWSPKGQGRTIIPARYLYSEVSFKTFKENYIRFLKVASLATDLRLTGNELAYFATHPDYYINGEGWLNVLAVSGAPALNVASALLKPFQALLDFARIKAELSPNDESLLTVLKDPTTATQKTDSLLFTLTRWNQTSLNDILAQFGKNTTELGHFDLFRRVAEAFMLLQKMDISAQALIQATTNEPTGNTVRNLQAALRARYDVASWRDVVQPINDEMRSLQRDALVAYILHQMRSHPESKHINTPDKLFEYFLMDVQMDPCMQTSRIRHALSSVQLFIERCLMNLEPRVSPAAINAKQWEWMKRYRVWEANRKVYLFPENWLEPELRDDKSPFFKEIESELLQSDITEERATIALLNYLSKLEEVAKLEVCGIHHIPADLANRTGEINHVVARTAGANRKYYYRRYEYGYWTPWKQIKLDIEDNPVIPVVWNGRLFLFWLRILKQVPIDPNSLPTSSGPKDILNNEKSLTDVKLSDLKTSAKEDAKTSTQMIVQAVLCWSEYYNGKWQATRTSAVDQPLGLDQYDLSGINAFDRSKLKLSVLFLTKGALRIIVSYDTVGVSFFLHNAYSIPEPRKEKKETHFSPKRTMETTTDTLKISYLDPNIPNSVLSNNIDRRTVQPNHPIEGNPWDAPFFYEDARHVFYVTTSEQLVPIWQHNDFGMIVTPPKMTLDIPQLVLEPVIIIPDPVGPISRQPGFGVIDPSPIERYVTEDVYIHHAIGTVGTVHYGNTEIGLAGSQIKSIRTK